MTSACEYQLNDAHVINYSLLKISLKPQLFNF